MNENIAFWDGPLGIGMRIRDANESRPRFSWMFWRAMRVVIRIDFVCDVDSCIKLGGRRHSRKCGQSQ